MLGPAPGSRRKWSLTIKTNPKSVDRRCGQPAWRLRADLAAFPPQPTLFLYGVDERPMKFHDDAWRDSLARRGDQIRSAEGLGIRDDEGFFSRDQIINRGDGKQRSQVGLGILLADERSIINQVSGAQKVGVQAHSSIHGQSGLFLSSRRYSSRQHF